MLAPRPQTVLPSLQILLPAERSPTLALRSPTPIGKSVSPGRSFAPSIEHSFVPVCLTVVSMCVTVVSIVRLTPSIARAPLPMCFLRLSLERAAVSTSHDSSSTDNVRTAIAGPAS
jgi:hypothetical protein